MAVLGDSQRESFLGAVPIFTAIPERLRTAIASGATWVQVPAGEWLFRQGDPGESLYVVRSGRLEVVAEEPLPTVVRVLGRGAAVGELSLLTGSTRSAAVRARRDSELLKIDREHFVELLADEPEFALALTRELGRQLQQSRGLAATEDPLPATMTLVPLAGGVPLERLVEQLVSQLRSFGDATVLDGRAGAIEPREFGERLDRAEREHGKVLLVADAPGADGEWTEFTLRQADRVLGLASGANVPERLNDESRLHGCDLVFHHEGSRAADMAKWIHALAPRAVHPLASGSFQGCVERLARRLTGNSVGVVLSGGGARGFCHIGVLEELLRAGITIDRVGGCSMGAYVGGMLAMELDPKEIRDRCWQEFVLRNPLSDYTVPVVSLLRGHRARAMLDRTFGSLMIEELPRDFFAVSCDLVSGDLIVYRQGPLYEAVGTSMCLPGVFAPYAREEYLLVDGGVLNNLPVEPMAAMAEGPVIAVDVSARFLPPGAKPRFGRPRIRQWAERSRRAVVGIEDPLPNLKEILTRTIGIGSVDALERARQEADLLIAPDTGSIPLLDFKQLDRMVEVGRVAARAALEAAPEFARR